MGGGPIIIIDPDKVKSPFTREETASRLRAAADALDSGELAIEAPDETE